MWAESDVSAFRCEAKLVIGTAACALNMVAASWSDVLHS